jgi:hypothetical protein
MRGINGKTPNSHEHIATKDATPKRSRDLRKQPIPRDFIESKPPPDATVRRARSTSEGPKSEIHELLGRKHPVRLSASEGQLWHNIVLPAIKGLRSPQREETLKSILGGGYVKRADGGELYRAIRGLEGAYIRESSHESIAPEFSAKLPNLGAILAGVNKDGSSWFQLEGSPQRKELKKKAEDFDARWVSSKELPSGYSNASRPNTGPNKVTWWDWIKHDLWDFPRYWWSGKKLNIGPYGSSPNTEKSNPIVL